MAADSLYKAEDYTVGWICALPVELAASTEMLDKEHPALPLDANDFNAYTFGNIGEHNIVIGCLPFGQMGLVSAASVAMHMKSRFRSIRFGLMVGVGGGVPSDDNDVRLGDVVVSRPNGQHGGVVQYDFGKTGPQGQHIRTGSLNSPPQILLTALATVEAARMRGKFKLEEYLSALGLRLPKFFAYPQSLQDKLYKSTYVHAGGPDCSKCVDDQLEERGDRNSTDVAIHYGTIASGNQVIKDGLWRDSLSRDLGSVLCFEMEAAGLMNNFPCLVIRGICDYSDSHKNKGWQPFAAATAAAFAKALLLVIPAQKLASEPTIDEAMKGLATRVAENTEVSRRVEERVSTAEEEKILQWLSSINFSKPQNAARETRTSGTGQWLLDLEAYKDWRDSSHGLLWLYGATGCGKTVLCSTAIDDLQTRGQMRLAYWYFQFSNDATQRIRNMLKSLIRQLSTSPLPDAVSRLWQENKGTGSDPGIEDLTNVLDEVIKSPSGEVFIVLDALDECPQTPDLQERKRLLAYIQNLLSKHSENLHILVTSRLEHDIDSHLMSYPSINIETFVEEDVRRFVKNSLQIGELKVWNEDIKQEIENGLLSIEKKRFRWADLQIRRLGSCYTNDQIHESLRTIPRSLEASYEEALNNIPKKDASIARMILMWLAISLRPMTINEIAAAVSLPQPEFVLRICTSMLVTLIHEHTDKVIKLAHFSVKEYLLVDRQKVQEGEGEAGYQFSNELAHATIGNAAVSYILETNGTNVNEQNIIEFPLLPYSAEYWHQHAAVVKDSMLHFPQLREQIDRIFSPEYSQSYLNWLRAHDCDDNDYFGDYDSTSKPFDQYPQPLYYASLLGFEHSIEILIGRGIEILEEDGTFEKAVLVAAIHGDSKIFARLLQENHKLDKGNISKILSEIKGNVEETIKVLLDTAASKTAAGELDWVEIQSSEWLIKTAVGNWENGLEVTKVLLDQLGAHVPITEGVMQAAARNGMSGNEIIQLLLDRRGADIEITDLVIEAAAGNGMSGVEVMTVLLERRRAHVQITTSVVKEAARNSKCGKKVMALLLDRQWADVRIASNIVEAIIEKFDDDIVRLLLSRQGADLQVTKEVVEAAARNSKSGIEILKLLLKRRDGDIQVTENVERAITALFNEETAETLLGGRKGVQTTEKSDRLVSPPLSEAHRPSPKGKLTVKISEIRGLKRARCDGLYVLIIFQRNEYISNDPLSESQVGAEGSTRNTTGGIPITRSQSDSGFSGPGSLVTGWRRSINDPASYGELNLDQYQPPTNIMWDIEAVFDVHNSDPYVSISIYDRAGTDEDFVGHINLEAPLTGKDSSPLQGWFSLYNKNNNEGHLLGEIHIEMTFQQIAEKHYGPDDFQILRLIGKGTFGQVFQVRKKATGRIYAMKVVQKKIIVQKKEVAHIVGERNILVRTAIAESPFISGLKFSFQTPTDLYLITDYISGGELFWHLQKEGRFYEERAKFYIAELILALQHLHTYNIIYRDLKPENILLDANGHITLCDFSLSKANIPTDTRTNTFCGTTEYLAPEALLDEDGYTKMVDFWSLGVLMFEMCCGWSPFYAEDTQQMYKNIAFGKVRFPRDALTLEGRNFVKGLLNRNPKHRLGATDGAEELKRHPFFADTDWEALAKKSVIPPFKPKLKPKPGLDDHLSEFPVTLYGDHSLAARAAALAAGVTNSTPLSIGAQAQFRGFTFVDESELNSYVQDQSPNDEFGEWDKDNQSSQTWEN